MKKYPIHILSLFLIAVFVFGFKYLPLQDYPVLLYEGFVFNQFIFHGNTFGGFFHLYPYMPPNAVSTIVLGTVDLFLDPFIAGKVYLFLLAAALYFGIFRFLTFHIKQNQIILSALAFYLTFNLHFVAGYLNFVSGFALVLHLIVLFREGKIRLNYLNLLLAIFSIYVCHFVALVLFGLYFIAYFLLNKKYKEMLRLSIASIPTIVIFVHYLLKRVTPILSYAEDNRTVFNIINGKFLVFFSPMIPFHNFKWIFDTPRTLLIADYFFSGIIFATIIYTLVKNIIRRNYALEFWLGSITLLLAFLLPLYFGGVLLPGERFVLFCVMNVFCLGFSDVSRPRMFKLITIGFALLAASSYGYLIWNTVSFNAILESGQIPNDAIIHPEWKREGTNGFLHFHYYDKIVLKKPYPIFDVGLFGYLDSAKRIAR